MIAHIIPERLGHGEFFVLTLNNVCMLELGDTKFCELIFNGRPVETTNKKPKGEVSNKMNGEFVMSS